jgi:hypothetical protein
MAERAFQRRSAPVQEETPSPSPREDDLIEIAQEIDERGDEHADVLHTVWYKLI